MGLSFILFIIGAVLGSLCDGLHTHSETLVYANPWLLKMAWWTPLLFGGAVVAIGLAPFKTRQWFRNNSGILSWKKMMILILFFVTIYVASGFLPANNFQKLILLGIASGSLWFFYERTLEGIVRGMMVAIIGCSIEIILITQGAFHYNHPDILGIPVWLPCLYFCGSVVIGHLGIRLSLMKLSK